MKSGEVEHIIRFYRKQIRLLHLSGTLVALSEIGGAWLVIATNCWLWVILIIAAMLTWFLILSPRFSRKTPLSKILATYKQ